MRLSLNLMPPDTGKERVRDSSRSAERGRLTENPDEACAISPSTWCPATVSNAERLLETNCGVRESLHSSRCPEVLVADRVPYRCRPRGDMVAQDELRLVDRLLASRPFSDDTCL